MLLRLSECFVVPHAPWNNGNAAVLGSYMGDKRVEYRSSIESRLFKNLTCVEKKRKTGDEEDGRRKQATNCTKKLRRIQMNRQWYDTC